MDWVDNVAFKPSLSESFIAACSMTFCVPVYKRRLSENFAPGEKVCGFTPII